MQYHRRKECLKCHIRIITLRNWDKCVSFATTKCHNCYRSVCAKFSQWRYCQILFELVYSWESYRKNKKGELFIETLCIYLLL